MGLLEGCESRVAELEAMSGTYAGSALVSALEVEVRESLSRLEAHEGRVGEELAMVERRQESG